jgi:hypothetical protein
VEAAVFDRDAAAGAGQMIVSGARVRSLEDDPVVEVVAVHSIVRFDLKSEVTDLEAPAFEGEKQGPGSMEARVSETEVLVDVNSAIHDRGHIRTGRR